jgi:acyl-CoA thioesterase
VFAERVELPEAYYLPVPGTDDEFDSTPATASPWDLTQQHGGPPSALLARAVDRTASDPALTTARLTVDMLGPIGQGRIRTEAEVVRPGRRVELVSARLYANDRLAVTATAWRIRETPGGTAHLAEPAPDLPPRPEAGDTTYFEGVPEEWQYGPSIDWRYVEGGFRGAATGVARVWARTRIPLVAGEETSGLHRMLTIADSANGVSLRLPITEWWSIPPTLSVTVLRQPPADDDGWFFFDARTEIGPDGRGIAHGTMSDRAGVLARVEQPLMVSRR